MELKSRKSKLQFEDVKVAPAGNAYATLRLERMNKRQEGPRQKRKREEAEKQG